MSTIYKNGTYYGQAGNPMPAADMEEIITPLPSVMSRYHTYSEDEQIVAYWEETVNNVKVKKPVYEKMIPVSAIPANQNYFITVTDLHISKIIYLGGCFRASNYTQQANLPFVHQNIAEYGITIWFDDSTNKIGIHTGTNFSIQTANVIVQYTKTTD